MQRLTRWLLVLSIMLIGSCVDDVQTLGETILWIGRVPPC